MNESAPVDEASPLHETLHGWQERIGEHMGEYIERDREAAQDLGGTLERQIREQPSRSVLIAAGLGFAIGMLWSRRS
jgi:ElaB/YqjD/DUF883 family membrane-anchored ribosome-binding protein